MTRTDISKKMEDILRIVFDNASLVIQDNLTAEDIEEWDSLNHINLIVAVEKEFQVRFTTREVYAAHTMGEFIDILEKKLERTFGSPTSD